MLSVKKYRIQNFTAKFMNIVQWKITNYIHLMRMSICELILKWFYDSLQMRKKSVFIIAIMVLGNCAQCNSILSSDQLTVLLEYDFNLSVYQILIVCLVLFFIIPLLFGALSCFKSTFLMFVFPIPRNAMQQKKKMFC